MRERALTTKNQRIDAETETFVVTHALRGEGFDASEDGTGRGTPIIAFPANLSGTQCASAEDVSPSLCAINPTAVAHPYTLAIRGRGDSHNLEYRTDGTSNAVLTPTGGRGGIGVGAIAFDPTQITSKANGSNPKPGDPCHTLAKGQHAPTIAYSTKLHNTKSNQAGKVYEGYTVGLDRNSPPPALLTAMQVRRLTPLETERLMGFPDGYTAITLRGKPAADGPRYKSHGNSWAINCARWVGERIQKVEAMKATS